MISFGPIPSRRLGKSLGINNISSQKVCTYSCIYCQVGITNKYSADRTSFFKPSVIYEEVKKHLQKLDAIDKPDYLTFVANGEPSLDINLGKSIEILKTFNIPIAVITNGSLLNDSLVREELSHADWVSVKIDTASKTVWKTQNRPLAKLDFDHYKNGLLKFSQEFKGELVSETMLVKGVNDSPEILRQTAELLLSVNPSTAYLSIPTRPPAIATVTAPGESEINAAYQIYTEKGLNTELMLGFEGTNTGFTGNAIDDIINICTVHPIREDTMQELLRKDNADPMILKSLIHGKHIQQVKFGSNTFYIRKFHS